MTLEYKEAQHAPQFHRRNKDGSYSPILQPAHKTTFLRDAQMRERERLEAQEGVIIKTIQLY